MQILTLILWVIFFILASATWLGWFLTASEIDLATSGIIPVITILGHSLDLAQLQTWLKATGFDFESLYTLAGGVFLAAVGSLFATLRTRRSELRRERFDEYLQAMDKLRELEDKREKLTDQYDELAVEYRKKKNRASDNDWVGTDEQAKMQRELTRISNQIHRINGRYVLLKASALAIEKELGRYSWRRVLRRKVRAMRSE